MLWWCGSAGLKAAATFGVGRGDVVAILVNGHADGMAPAVGAEGVDVFVLGEVDGLHESLDQISDGVGGLGFYVAAKNGGDEACQSGAEIAGGDIVAGKEEVHVATEGFGGVGTGFFLGMIEAEMGMVAGTRGAATAAIRERKRTQGH